MNKDEIIVNLKRQKQLLSQGVYDQNALELFLNENPSDEITTCFRIYGVSSINQINDCLCRIYPFQLSNPSFVRIQESCRCLSAIALKNADFINISVGNRNKQYKKIYRYDKAA